MTRDPAVVAERLSRAKAGGEAATGVDRIEHRIDTAGFAGDPSKLLQAVDDSFTTVQRWRRHRGLLVRLLLADGFGPGLLGHRLARLDEEHRGGREQCGGAQSPARPVADRGERSSTVAVDRQLAGSVMIEAVGCEFHGSVDGNTGATRGLVSDVALDAGFRPRAGPRPVPGRQAGCVEMNRVRACAHGADAHRGKRVGAGTCGSLDSAATARVGAVSLADLDRTAGAASAAAGSGVHLPGIVIAGGSEPREGLVRDGPPRFLRPMTQACRSVARLADLAEPIDRPGQAVRPVVCAHGRGHVDAIRPGEHVLDRKHQQVRSGVEQHAQESIPQRGRKW